MKATKIMMVKTLQIPEKKSRLASTYPLIEAMAIDRNANSTVMRTEF